MKPIGRYRLCGHHVASGIGGAIGMGLTAALFYGQTPDGFDVWVALLGFQAAMFDRSSKRTEQRRRFRAIAGI